MMQGLSFTRILNVFVLFSHSLQFLLSSHQFSVGDAEEDEDGEEEEELPADELVEGPLHTPGYLDTWIPGYLDAWMPGCPDTWMPGP